MVEKLDPSTGYAVMRLQRKLSFFPADAIRQVVHMYHLCPAKKCGRWWQRHGVALQVRATSGAQPLPVQQTFLWPSASVDVIAEARSFGLDVCVWISGEGACGLFTEILRISALLLPTRMPYPAVVVHGRCPAVLFLRPSSCACRWG